MWSLLKVNHSSIKWLFVIAVLAILNVSSCFKNLSLERKLANALESITIDTSFIEYVYDTIYVIDKRIVYKPKIDTVTLSHVDTIYNELFDTVYLVKDSTISYLYSNTNYYLDSTLTVVDSVYFVDNLVQKHIQNIEYARTDTLTVINNINVKKRKKCFLLKLFGL